MKINSLKIGDLSLEIPIIAAPLAGISDKGYRRILRDHNVPLSLTEMVSAKALIYENKKSLKIINLKGEEGQTGIQIFGKDPGEVSEGVKIAMAEKPVFIDFNMGCPAPKIVNNGEGSALLKDQKLGIRILEKMIKVSNVPITVKVRKSFNSLVGDALPFILEAEKIGVAMVFVHGRTREEFYSGKSDWESIARIKNSVKIPVIGNGDVNSPESAEAIFKKTRCDGALIGRGFLGNPFCYEEIESYFKTGKIKKTTFDECLEAMMTHLKYVIEDKGEVLGVREFRKHLGWYLKGVRNASFFREEAFQVESFSDVEKLKASILDRLRR